MGRSFCAGCRSAILSNIASLNQQRREAKPDPLLQPLTINKVQIDETVDILRAAIVAVTGELIREGLRKAPRD